MTKTYTLVVLAILVLGSVALAAGQNQFAYNPNPPSNPDKIGAPGDDSGAAATPPATTPTTPTGVAPAQYGSPYPPPTIVVVPAPQPSYPPPTYVAPEADKEMNPLSIVGAILGIAAVVTIAVALLVQNAQRGAENNRPNDGPAFGTSIAQLGMMEGQASALTIAPSGATTYVTGTRPAGSATMPGAQDANPAASAPAIASGTQLAVINAALTAAGVAAPTPAQLERATNTVVNNWARFGRNAAARQTAANAAVQAALRGAGLI